MAKVVEDVHAILKPVLETKGFDLWDVLYEKQDSDFVLRVLIDRVEGEVNMDDLVMLTEIISEQLDSITPDPFPQAYLLDVSSPGADRELKEPQNFIWAVGKFVEIELYDAISDSKMFTGQLVAFKDMQLTLDVLLKGKHQLIEIPFVNVKTAKLAISQDRVLVSDEDYDWALNKLVHVSTYQKIDGKKEFSGELTQVTEENLVITSDDDVEFVVPRRAVAQAKQSNDF